MGKSPLCTNHKNEQEFEKLFDAMSCEKKITVKVILRQSSWFTDHKESNFIHCSINKNFALV